MNDRINTTLHGFERSTILVLLALFTILAVEARAEQQRSTPAYLGINVGTVGLLDSLSEPTRYGIDYRFRPRGRWKFAPAVGAAHARNDASFVYADIRRDFWIGHQWGLTPSFGIGLFDDGNGLRLGHTIEFRSGIEIMHQFKNRRRLSLAFYHLSNGGIADRNPGTEAAVLSFFVPVGGRRGE